MDIKPLLVLKAGKPSTSVSLSKAVTCRHTTALVTYAGGDAYAIEPGHDAWVVGDKPVAYEFHGAWRVKADIFADTVVAAARSRRRLGAGQ